MSQDNRLESRKLTRRGFHWSMLPTLRLLQVLVVAAPLWLLGAALPASPLLGVGLVGWLASGLFWGGLAVIVGLNWRQLPTPAQLTVKRILPSRFSFDDAHDVTLELTSHSPHALFLTLREELPEGLETDEVLFQGMIPPMGQLRLTYSALAVQRGAFTFGDVVVRVETQLRLISRELRCECPDAIKIYPRFRGVDDFLLLARLSERDEAVRQPRQLRGAGSDFESLRPYVMGDDLRHVDWKASARRGQLISRNRQVEKGQQLAILIDAGRLMAGQIGRHSRLEHFMNAAVRLAYVVQRRGDALALGCFSNRIETFMPSERGTGLLPRVLERVYTVQVRLVESDYWQVVSQMMGRLKRRSLVIMMTDVLDSAGSEGLMNNLMRASSRHLVLCVVLHEPRVLAEARQEPQDVAQAYQKAAACDLLRRRRLALEHMRARGILVLETDPEHLSISLVRRYLEIRQADLQ